MTDNSRSLPPDAFASLDALVSSDKLPMRPKSAGSAASIPKTPPQTRAGLTSHETLAPPPLYSSRSRSSPRKTPPTKVLGAIDENGGMAPDIPIKNPRRNQHTFTKTPNFISHLFPGSSPKLAYKLRPPESVYEGVTGPHGEKFNDVRANKVSPSPPRSLKSSLMGERSHRWRKWACVGLVLVMVVAITAIGLVVGLTRRKHHRYVFPLCETTKNDLDTPLSRRPNPNANLHILTFSFSNKNIDNDSSSPSNTTSAPLTAYPVGTYTLQPYLLSTNSSCTPNPNTWRCYPYQTYSSSPTNSMTTLNWVISGTNISGRAAYSISASSNPFALPFSNADLKLVDTGTADERYTFSTILEKVVVPDAVITSDGSTARCYYNGSTLIGDLYTKKSPDLRTGSGNDQWWPHAVQVRQVANSAPDCWKTVNGMDVERVNIGSGGNGECECEYADFGS